MTLKTLFQLTKKEGLFLAALVLVYGFLAYFNLGTKIAPETYSVVYTNEEAFEFQVEEAPKSISLYAPVNDSTKYVGIRIFASADGEHWTKAFDTRDDDTDYTAAMIWYNYPLQTSEDTRYIKIQKLEKASRLALAEVQFWDLSGEAVAATPLNEASALLLDEPATVFKESDRMNSAYFDESYFPSSALEMADGLSIAEMDHPPVGRLIIGLGMAIFGRNPLGFRFMQATFGILMLPLIYYFGRALLRSKKWAAFATVVLALDFMHYTQTRIGTLDAFLVTFILAMYAFMYFYSRCEGGVDRLICLGLSGVFTGLAIGTKWSGCYAALGLALYFFVNLAGDCRRGSKALRRRGLRECLWCLVFFIAVPLTIYGLSYIPYVRCMADGRGFFETIVNHQKTMLGYHTGSATHFVHPYSSKWWTWFLALKPVFYYFKDGAQTVYLYGTGNPLIWGLGLLGCVYALVSIFVKKDRDALLVATAYFSQLVPWCFITRDTFLYHYFPMVPFLILGLAYLLEGGFRSAWGRKWRSLWSGVFLALAAICFGLAFPFIYGSPMEWRTILILRAAFLILTAVMALFMIFIFIKDKLKWRRDRKLWYNEEQVADISPEIEN
ncbi:MAG: phospholipid carrier-dependent glycosyltransferase [Eubacterium sp.]|nr:phospholipid carrier-dependent glycosyltransferase [Eubacterium sp.]